ncbi:MAG: serine hydrolase domain-containing protein [Calditrichia bacterium]
MTAETALGDCGRKPVSAERDKSNMKNFVYYVLITLFFVTLFSCTRQELPQKSVNQAMAADSGQTALDSLQIKTATRLDSFFSAKYQRNNFNGAVLFAQKGKVVFKKAYGFANYRKKDSLTTRSIFQLASVSKPLTAYAVMLLKQNGKLDYEDEVGKYIADFPYPGITIRMLLTHRSGLPNYMYFADRFWHSRRKPIFNRDVVDLMIRHKPLHYYKPNVRYNYCNTNYALLALIIEKVSGKSYENFMKEEVFQPLEMFDSVVYRNGEIRNGDGVTGYDRRGRVAENSYLNGVVGDKGIYSSVEDLFKWDQAMYQGSLVRHETLAEAFVPAHPDLRDYDNYGFGWRIDASDSQNKVVYHSGWWKGFRSYFIRKLGEQKTIIILTNHIRRSQVGIRFLRSLF